MVVDGLSTNGLERWGESLGPCRQGALDVSALSEVAARPVTVGLFAWVGGIEWHVHAWDFARSVGDEYRAADASSLYASAGALYGRPISDEDPWEATLDRLRPHRAVTRTNGGA